MIITQSNLNKFSKFFLDHLGLEKQMRFDIQYAPGQKQSFCPGGKKLELFNSMSLKIAIDWSNLNEF